MWKILSTSEKVFLCEILFDIYTIMMWFFVICDILWYFSCCAFIRNLLLKLTACVCSDMLFFIVISVIFLYFRLGAGIEVKGSDHYSDPGDLFEREPFSVLFHVSNAGNKLLTLLHILLNEIKMSSFHNALL